MYIFLGKVTCGDVSADDNLLIVGSEEGVIRIIDISNSKKCRCLA